MNWPNEDTDFEMLLWVLVNPQTREEQKLRAHAELVRRLGSLIAVPEVIRERAALGAPLGLLPDWQPQRLRGSPEDQIWEVRTESGSLYRLIREPAGRWWLEVTRNLPSPDVLEINGRTPIGCPHPFPPRLGLPMTIPLLGLGKLRLTSSVVDVTGPEEPGGE